jgi:hypothetical protein
MAFPYFTAGIDVNAIRTDPSADFTATGLYNAGFRRKARGVPRLRLTLPWRAGLWQMKTSSNCYSPRARQGDHI